MRPISVITRAALLTAAILAAACSGDSPSGPPPQQSLDLSALFSEMASPLGRTVTTAPGGVTPLGSSSATAAPPIVPSRCTYSDATKSFDCPTVAANGLTITQSYTLYDAAGRPQSQADPAVIASVKTVTTVRGTITTPPVGGAPAGSIAMDRREEMTLSGLLTGTHALNGVARSTMTGTLGTGNTAQQFTTTQTETTTNLVLPTVTSGSAAGSQWPRSGTITIDMTSTISVAGQPPLTTTMRQQMTFNGTSKVTVTITLPSGTITCTLDFANPSALPACSG